MASRAVYTTVNQERTWVEILIKFTTQEYYDLIIELEFQAWESMIENNCMSESEVNGRRRIGEAF